MSTRTVLRPAVVLNAGSMVGNLTSLPTVIQGLSGISYEVSWSGSSPVGTISVQTSNSYSLNPNGVTDTAGTWTTIYLNVNGTPATTMPVSGNTGNGFSNLPGMEGYAIRLIYTAGSGTGALTAIVSGKVQ